MWRGNKCKIESLPSGTDGPVLRRETLGLSTPWQAPRPKRRPDLAGIWQQVLGIDAVGTADDFFDLGGDWFAATGLASEIEATFGLRFTPSDIISIRPWPGRRRW